MQYADAEDLTQRVFVAVARAVERWEPSRGGARFRSWLYRIATNEIIRAITRRKPDMGSGSSSVDEQL